MAQIRTTRDQPYPGLCSNRLKVLQRPPKALIFGIARPFSDIEALNKKRFMDVGRITLTV
jgi:hypothetical protein